MVCCSSSRSLDKGHARMFRKETGRPKELDLAPKLCITVCSYESNMHTNIQ
jgi:hypothetical protein